MQKKESAERKMSKIKTKKVLTPEQKKKRIRNIIIVAVILVAASVATYWMHPRSRISCVVHFVMNAPSLPNFSA